jgi:hypothetical protein
MVDRIENNFESPDVIWMSKFEGWH